MESISMQAYGMLYSITCRETKRLPTHMPR